MKEMENKRLEQENTELKMEARIYRKFIVNLLFKITNLEEKIEYIEAENKIIYGDGSNPEDEIIEEIEEPKASRAEQ